MGLCDTESQFRLCFHTDKLHHLRNPSLSGPLVCSQHAYLAVFSYRCVRKQRVLSPLNRPSCFRSPPNPLSTPPAGLSQVWAGRGRLLRFCHDTGNLSLTVRQNRLRNWRHDLRADILLLMQRLRDDHFLKEVS